MASLDLFIVNLAFPDIQRDFGGTDIATLSWILNAYAIVFAALLVPAGRWADAMGRRRGFLLGLSLFTLASAACAAAPSVNALIAARVAQAAGAALLLPTSLGLLLPAFPAEKRHIAIGIWAASGGVAAAFGPPLGGLLVQVSWHWVFIVNLPVGIAALVAGTRVLSEIRDPDPRRPDAIGAALLAGGVGALIVAIVKGGEWGWTGARVAGLIAAAIVLVGFVAWRSTWHPAPVVDPALARVRALRASVGAAALFFVAFAGFLLGSVLFLTDVWHEDVLTAGLMLSPGPLAAAAFSVPGARLGARYGHRAVGVAGTLLFAAGAIWWRAKMGPAEDFTGAWLPALLVGGAGVGLVNPALTGAAASALPPARFATGAALLTMGRQLGSALGVAVMVAVLGAAPALADFQAAWFVVIAGSLAAAAGMLGVGPHIVGAPAPVAPLDAAAEGHSKLGLASSLREHRAVAR
jgi:EmrB/QacA subfamily drug resistance transporter